MVFFLGSFSTLKELGFHMIVRRVGVNYEILPSKIAVSVI